MLKNRKFGAFALASMLLVFVGMRLVAQTATATILGTVTDSSGGAIPGATVKVMNTGTGATQVIQTDPQGRYRVPALPVGEYDVQSEKAGFESGVRNRITLTVGADVVVDFALPVGQVTQSVTVQGNVTQVETQSTAVSNLVDPTQMRELPLNGRDFEQLILLSPGVSIHQSIGYTAANGFGNSYSVSGSRTRGQWELLDDNDVMNWQGRGAGSGVLGTQLGVDAIAEFQVLTNTYSAQYGGNGAAMIAVTRSGTNSFHGSGYEFIRNSALDARNFFDPATIPSFKKNQFGGTFGGPIKKDKMFFFVNYEGLRQNTGVDYPFILPDAAAFNGFAPNSAGVYTCVNSPGIAYAGGTSALNNAACKATIPAAVQNFMKYFPSPSAYPYVVDTQTISGAQVPNGLITNQETAASPGSENYLVARYDWTISTKDSMFARYVRDAGNLFEPFVGATLSPAAPVNGSQDRSLDQFVSIEEKHIVSSDLGSASRVQLTRRLPRTVTATTTMTSRVCGRVLVRSARRGRRAQLASFLWLIRTSHAPPLAAPPASGIFKTNLGGARTSTGTKVPIICSSGRSSKEFKALALHPRLWGPWIFANVSQFLAEAPLQYTAVCNSALFAACSALPTQNPVENFRHTEFGFYLQDAWRVTNKITLNIGLRYSPETNPTTVGQTRLFLNMPFSPSFNPLLPMPGCTVAAGSGTVKSCGPIQGALPSTPVSHVYLSNPTLRNFEPRIGIAWDPFSDHKTAVRAGYGIFSSPVLPYDYTQFIPIPYLSVSAPCVGTLCSTFPNPPFSAGGNSALPPIGGSGIDPGDRSNPYMEQYNLTVQHQIARNTTLSVGYIGSHGVHLIGNGDENPPLPAGVPGAITVGAGKVLAPSSVESTQLSGGFTAGSTPVSANGQAIVDPGSGQQIYATVQCPAATPTTGCSVVANNRVDPALYISNMKNTTFWSHYNSLQVNLARRLTNNAQFQVAYTWGSCLTNSGGSTTFENGWQTEDLWNPNLDRGNCAFLIRHDLSVNGIYMIPFKGNRLVTGWQLGGIFTFHTGPVGEPTVGWASEVIGATSGPIPSRPDVISGCNQILGTVAHWVNTNCYTMAPIGEPGNAPYMGIFGPDNWELDSSIVKNTKITERFNVQFRAEFFNILNHANFRPPGQGGIPIYQEASPLPSSCATVPQNCSTLLPTAGQIILTNGNSRQIQFGLKVTF